LWRGAIDSPAARCLWCGGDGREDGGEHRARVPRLLVDFELADIEAPVADIAFCLWRSGRPAQAAKELDALRVRDLLGGYCSVRPLDDAQLAAIPVCLRGRGLQMLAKRTQLGVADDGPVHQLAWLETHER